MTERWNVCTATRRAWKGNLVDEVRGAVAGLAVALEMPTGEQEVRPAADRVLARMSVGMCPRGGRQVEPAADRELART